MQQFHESVFFFLRIHLYPGQVFVGQWRRGNRVVGIYDGHNVEADELRHGAGQMAARFLVVEVRFRHQHLGDFHAVLREHGVVKAHQSRLTDGGRSPGLDDERRLGAVLLLA